MSDELGNTAPDERATAAWHEVERRAMALAERALEEAPDGPLAWLGGVANEQPVVLERARELVGLSNGATTLESHASHGLASVADINSGSRLGNYVVEHEIGRGGMGVVYQGRRADDAFDLEVAIKVMRPVVGLSPQRFESERHILARLDHPHVARILDGGRTDQELPYLVMELIEGAPIDRYCDHQRLGVRERIELFLRVCDGVAHAHRNLVVHRDLKPGNILVTNEGQPKLLDFGIAKLMEADGPAEATVFGLGAMTPEYASPEQVRRQPITVATDVYSLGVILFELITGERPYTLDDRSPSGIERVVCETTPPLPSSKVRVESAKELAARRRSTPDQLSKQLRGDLDSIVLAALGKEESERYATVDALTRDLRNYLEGRPVEARRQTWLYVVRRFLARNARQTALAAAALALILAGATTAIVQSLRAQEQAQIAVAESEKLATVNLFLENMLRSGDPLIGSGPDTTVQEFLEGALGRLDELDAVSRANLARTIGETYFNLGMADEAVAALEAERDRAHRLLGSEHEESAYLDFVLAKQLLELGNAERGLQLLEDAAPVMYRVRPQDTATVHTELANGYAMLDRPEEAEREYRRGVQLARAQATAPGDLAVKLQNFAVFLGSYGRFDESERLLREALALVEAQAEAPGGEHLPVAPQVRSSLAATISFVRPDDPEVLALHARSIAEFDQLLGPQHPTTIGARNLLANASWNAGRIEDGLEIATPNLQLAREHLPEDHQQRSYAGQVYSGLMVAAGRAREIEETIRFVIDQRRQRLPEGHWLVASSETLLGACLVDLGRWSEAREILERSHATLLEHRGPDDANTVRAAQLLERARAGG